MNKESVKKDLELICAETNAQYLCYDDIHTLNPESDVEKFIKAFETCGFSKEDLLNDHYIAPRYGGGLEICHSNEAHLAGYTISSEDKKNNLIVLSGFDLPWEKQTIYHEAAHLYQVKCGLLKDFDYETPYGKYIHEIHADTFASMVTLLKAKNVLEYKKEKLSRLLDSVDRFYCKNDSMDKDMIYYMALPIELEMMRQIRRKGRKKVLKEFLRGKHLDFEKLASYTAELVRKNAYSKEDFTAILEDKEPAKYAYLNKRVKAWRILGRVYNEMLWMQAAKKIHKHAEIERLREIEQEVDMKNLPEISKENKIINAVCAIDTYYVALQRVSAFDYDLDRIVKGEQKIDLVDGQKFEPRAIFVREKITDLWEKWKDDPYFQKLYQKIKSVKTRDEVWLLKDKKMLSSVYRAMPKNQER